MLWLVAFVTLSLMPLLLAMTRAGADLGLCIIVLLFLSYSTITKNWEWTKAPEIKTLGMLWLFMLAASAFSPISIKSSFIAAAIWGRFILFFAAARFWLLQHREAVEKINMVGLCILVFIVIDTAWQYKTGTSLTGRPMLFDRLTGPLTKANIGNFLVKVGFPMLGMASYLMISKGQTNRLWMPAAGLLAMISLIMVSGERSTVILMLLALGMVGLTVFIAQPKLRKWVVMTGVAIMGLLGLLAATQPVVMHKANFFVEQGQTAMALP